MIEAKFKLEYIEKGSRYKVLHALKNEVSPELKEDAEKVVQLVLFSQKVEGSEEEQINVSMMFLIDSLIETSNQIPIHESAMMIDLISMGLKKYYNVQLLIQTELQKAIETLNKLSQDCRNEDGYVSDYVLILKNWVCLKFMRYFLKQEKDYISLYLTIWKQLPSPEDFRHIFKALLQECQISCLKNFQNLTTHLIVEQEEVKKPENDKNEEMSFKQYNSLLNDFKNLILDADRLTDLDKARSSNDENENILKSVKLSTKPKDGKIYGFSYQEIWDMIYTPIIPDSPYDLVKSIIVSYKLLYNINSERKQWRPS